MIPQHFEEENINFFHPEDLSESQVSTIPAFAGVINTGSLDGCRVVVTCWKPDEQELELLKQGHPIFLSFIGGLPPHFPCMSFKQAINPA